MFNNKAFKICLMFTTMLQINSFAMNCERITVVTCHDFNKFRPIDVIGEKIVQIDDEAIMSDLFINAFWNTHINVEAMIIVIAKNIRESEAIILSNKFIPVINSFPNLRSIHIQSNSPQAQILGKAIEDRWRGILVIYEGYVTPENPLSWEAGAEAMFHSWPPEYGQRPESIAPSSKAPPSKVVSRAHPVSTRGSTQSSENSRKRPRLEAKVIFQKEEPKKAKKRPKLLEKQEGPTLPPIVSASDRAIIDEVILIYRQLTMETLKLLEKKIEEINEAINGGKLATADYDAHIIEHERLGKEYESQYYFLQKLP